MSATTSPADSSTATGGPTTTTTPTTSTSTAAATVTNAIVKTVEAIISSTAPAASQSPSPSPSGFSTPTQSPTSSSTPTTTASMGGPEEKLSVQDLSQTLQHFGVVDYLVFIAMLAVCAVIGVYFGFIEKKQKAKKKGQLAGKDGAGAAGVEERRGSEALDYLVGGRQMKVFPVALSLVASFVSGISLLGTSTEIYVYGTQYAFILVTLAISGAISWYIFLPVFCNLQLTSTYEYFEMRFNKSVRLLGSALFTCSNLIWLPIVIFVPALAFNQDVIQTIVMVFAIFFVIIKGTMDVGGLGVVIQRNFDSGRLEWPEMTFDPKVRMSMIAMMLGNVGQFAYQLGCNQIIIQRYNSLPGKKEMAQTSFIFIVGLTVLNAVCLYNGLLLYATYYDCDPLTTKLAVAKDQLVPLLVVQSLSSFPGVPGMFVAGVFSAALSSLSTGLNSLAAVFLEDYIKPLRKKPMTEHEVAITVRLCTVIIGVLSVGLVFVVERMGTHVMQLSMTVGAIVNGPLMGLFVMGLLIPSINSKSALLGTVVSFFFMAWLCLSAQMAVTSGEMQWETKPVSTDGCTYEFERPLVTPANVTIPKAEQAFHLKNYFYRPLSFGEEIYHVSFMFYSLIGSAVAVVVAQLAGFFFGRNDPKDVDPDLLSPCIRRFYKTNYATYFQLRYGAGIRNLGAVLFIVDTTIWLPLCMYIPAITYSQVTGTGIYVITPIVCIICTFYTCVGGLKAVIWSDVIQSFVMFGSILVVCIKGTSDVGGLAVVLQRNEESGRLNAPEWTWDPTVRLSMLSVIVGGTLHKIQSSDVNQISIQRFLSLPSYEHAKRCMQVFTLLLIFLLSCCCYMGLVSYAVYHECDPISTKLAKASDQLPSLLMMRTLGSMPGLPGLFVAGVFSAALSSLSTGLNSLACVLTQDIVQPLLKKPLTERQTACWLRGIVVGFGFSCIGMVKIVEKLGNVVPLATTVGAVSMGPLLGIYGMGVGLPWVKGKSVMVGSLVSFLVLAWICINAQLGQMNGEIRYPKMPVSVEGCDYSFDNATVFQAIHDYSPSERNLYHLSFFWYTAFGGVICTVFSLLASLFFGWEDLSQMDPALITPCMRRFLPKKNYQAVKMQDLFKRKECHAETEINS
ncbi:GL21802 [Drosophila persimilis]|uniref:GL21802 n=1 Tax=Drosophila persimilis TaxID=7234 RepID=B4GEI7_DROPE|nr:GL21802 [Drosophila persimilis]